MQYISVYVNRYNTEGLSQKLRRLRDVYACFLLNASYASSLLFLFHKVKGS